MNDNNKKKNSEAKRREDKKNINPSDITGKIEVKDTRERRDGPGGN